MLKGNYLQFPKIKLPPRQQKTSDDANRCRFRTNLTFLYGVCMGNILRNVFYRPDNMQIKRIFFKNLTS